MGAGATVSEVARRRDVRAQQPFGWRRAMRLADPEPQVNFVPALIEAVDPAPARLADAGLADGLPHSKERP